MPQFTISSTTNGKGETIETIHRPTCKTKGAQSGKTRNLSSDGGRVLCKTCKPTFEPAGASVTSIDKARSARSKQPAKSSTAAKSSSPAATKASERKPAGPKTTIETPDVSKIPDIGGAHAALAAGADPHPGLRAELADVENKAKRQARSAGEPIPATPNADFVAVEYANGLDAKGRKTLVHEYEAALRGEAKRGRGGKTQSVRYYRDGKPQPDSQNRFSSLAYGFTRNVGRERPRMPSTELRDLIVKTCGVTDVENEPWSITLDNGEQLESRIEDGSTARPPKPRGTSAAKPTASKDARGEAPGS